MGMACVVGSSIDYFLCPPGSLWIATMRSDRENGNRRWKNKMTRPSLPQRNPNQSPDIPNILYSFLENSMKTDEWHSYFGHSTNFLRCVCDVGTSLRKAATCALGRHGFPPQSRKQRIPSLTTRGVEGTDHYRLALITNKCIYCWHMIF